MPGRRKVKSGDHWRILYRIGGRDRCRWVVVLKHYRLKSEAIRDGKAIAKQGYKVRMMPDKYLQSIGMPVGWDAADADAGHFEDGWWIRDKQAKPEAEPKPADA